MDKQLTLLYKRFLGTPNSIPSNSYAQEEAGSSRSNIFAQSQLYNQPVPPVAPTDLALYGYASIDSSNNTIINSISPGLGTIENSVLYPWIQN